MAISIRSADAGDGPVIAGLLTQLGYPAAGDEVSERLSHWTAEPASQILLAVDNKTVLGCLSLHAFPYLERAGNLARITSLVIDENARGTGIGRALMGAAEDLARAWGCVTMEVTSSRSRAGAHTFYQRMGYTDICDRSSRFLKNLS